MNLRIIPTVVLEFAGMKNILFGIEFTIDVHIDHSVDASVSMFVI